MKKQQKCYIYTRVSTAIQVDGYNLLRDEDIDVDAMSPGEIYVQKLAGYSSDKIFYIGNNVSKKEMQYAIDENVLVIQVEKWQ